MTRAEFEAWASAEGYDMASTYDTERSRWVWLNPMTADLWRAWQASRAQALEEAASKAGEKSASLPHYNDFVKGYANGRSDAAAAIRALGDER